MYTFYFSGKVLQVESLPSSTLQRLLKRRLTIYQRDIIQQILKQREHAENLIRAPQ